MGLPCQTNSILLFFFLVINYWKNGYKVSFLNIFCIDITDVEGIDLFTQKKIFTKGYFNNLKEIYQKNALKPRFFKFNRFSFSLKKNTPSKHFS